jgi:hypothetical protein
MEAAFFSVPELLKTNELVTPFAVLIGKIKGDSAERIRM